MRFSNIISLIYRLLSYFVLTLAMVIILVVLGIFLYIKYGGNDNFAEFRFENTDYKVITHNAKNQLTIKPNDTIYYITVSTETNIDSVLQKRKAVNFYMVCPTENKRKSNRIDTDIYPRVFGDYWQWKSNKKSQSYKLGNRYFYTFEMSFENSPNKKGSFTDFQNKQIEYLLCRIFMIYYFSKPNDKSNVFNITFTKPFHESH